MSSPAVTRLIRDLKDLKEDPLIGASCEPLDNNIMVWYGIVIGLEGTAYEGIPIRFTLEFGPEYPNKAPKCYFDVDIKYAGGLSYKDVSGRFVVCLNIFGNLDNVHTEWASQQEGWTPSYSVKTILLSMQALMLSDMLSSLPENIEAVRVGSKNFKCSLTGHNGASPETWFPQVIMSGEAFQTQAKKYDPYRDFYCCYVKKDSHADGAELGYGISVLNPRGGILSSPCEYLSKLAFDEGNRRSSTNVPFEYWLPICIDSNSLEIVMTRFIDCVEKISTALKFSGPIEQKVCKVCSSIMCSLVIEVMNKGNNLTANDKFINGYFAVYRLFLEYSKINKKLVTLVNKTLQDFKTKDKSRSKDVVPNIGEMLVALTVSTISWEDISDIFLLECDARNVFWYCVGNNRSPAQYRELISPAYTNQDRVTKVFNATRTSQNFVMFQAKFSEVAKSLTSDVMDSNHGMAPNNLLVELKDTYRVVTSIKNWNEYFHFLKLPNPTVGQRNQQLIDAVNVSRKQGYTK